MLSDTELDIVRRHKQWGFGAYLQWAWFVYPSLQKTITSGKTVELERLRYMSKRMDDEKNGFDFLYLESLPEQPVNPLTIEQDAWRLLSPMVASYIESFDQYVKSCTPEVIDRAQLLSHVTHGFELLKKWNVISKSFGIKYNIAEYLVLPQHTISDETWLIVPEKEKDVLDLIQELAISM